jgi:hypothetical protein
LFALWDKPATATQILEDSAVHHLFIEPAQQAVKRFSLSQSHSHGSFPFYRMSFIDANKRNAKPTRLGGSASRPVMLWLQ